MGQIINDYTRFSRIIIMLVLVVASFLVLQPFISSILSGAILAYIFYPWYKKLYQKTKLRSVSALIVSVVLVLIISIPLVFILNSLWQEAFTIYLTGKQTITTTQAVLEHCSQNNVLCDLVLKGKDVLAAGSDSDFMELALKKISATVTELSSDFIIRLPQKILYLFIVMFVMYYLLIDGKRLVDKLWAFVEIKKHRRHMLQDRIANITGAVIYGVIITSMLQGFIAAIGYWIFGINSPIFWGLITALAAILPFVGTAFIWVPASLLMFFNGVIANDTSQTWSGVGLFLYGVIIISTIDNLIRPKLIGDKGKVHPVTALLGVLGGLFVFGYVGIILGPLVLAITWELLVLLLPGRKIEAGG